ncbi:general amino acid permease 1 [Artomyces pyxidatus]|uniref:General amino acid permease 1 n=2 Tax=Artomyces pyxidatus TaxID=48021 RepID=A0ACB8SH85_9AGAM|nr:general amino acid permease 1 [Artomyces pyxidatus]KAI0055299.1 general amino acid permease 1 [Artomyces pyxidatus]
MSSEGDVTYAGPDIEKKASIAESVQSGSHGGPVPVSFYHQDRDKVQRSLNGWHIQMFAIAGVIGTGLFLGLGSLLTVTGPLGALIVFTQVGTVAFTSLASITEMAAFAPISGSFSHYAARWVDPALGFAVGWNYFYTCAITLPGEITAAAALIGYWDHNPDHVAIYVAVIIVVVYAVNLMGARRITECSLSTAEIVFGTLKRELYLFVVIGGLVITSGGGPDHRTRGFQYWRHPGPLVSSLEPGARGRFIGLLLGIVYAAFSMCGMEIVTLAAAETRNPRKNLVKAMRTVFFRIFICYILTTFIIGLLIASNDPDLFKKTGNAGQSPFVLVFNRAGVKVLPHIVNAVVLTSAFSSANGMLFSASRLLFALGVQGHAPRFVTKVSKSGLPYVAIILGGLLSFLAFLNVNNHAGRVFNWFVNLSAVGSLFSWMMIGITYLRYYYGLKAQGIKREGIYGVYRSRLQPYGAMWVIFWSLFFILTSGISVFWSFNGPDFVAAYINIPIFVLLYVGWKVYKRTKIVPLKEMDFVTGIPSVEETEEAGFVEKSRGLRKVRDFL